MNIHLANPRGFCAGVKRALATVDEVIEKSDKPVYIFHEIVHNKIIVSRLKQRGAVFVKDLNQMPEKSIIIFSAHGVAKSVVREAKKRKLRIIDATCPLVKKVHSSIQKFEKKNTSIVLIGHKGHPEVVGSMGQLSKGEIKLISSVEDVDRLEVSDPKNIAYVTQTTLAYDEMNHIIKKLKLIYPNISGPKHGDICYATTTRQNGIKEIASDVNIFLIIGSAHSSNSNRLKEIGNKLGKKSYLIDDIEDIRKEWFDNIKSVGITSSASAPEDILQDVIKWIKTNYPPSKVLEKPSAGEKTSFPMPAELSDL